jgi:hypothetical protein
LFANRGILTDRENPSVLLLPVRTGDRAPVFDAVTHRARLLKNEPDLNAQAYLRAYARNKGRDVRSNPRILQKVPVIKFLTKREISAEVQGSSVN